MMPMMLWQKNAFNLLPARLSALAPLAEPVDFATPELDVPVVQLALAQSSTVPAAVDSGSTQLARHAST